VLARDDPAVTDALASGREVILFDNAGIGRSTGTVPETVADMAKHALAFIDGLGLATCDVRQQYQTSERGERDRDGAPAVKGRDGPVSAMPRRYAVADLRISSYWSRSAPRHHRGRVVPAI
jgi:hypothetical protein